MSVKNVVGLNLEVFTSFDSPRKVLLQNRCLKTTFVYQVGLDE